MTRTSGDGRAKPVVRKPFGERVAIISDLLVGRISRAEACRRFSIEEIELDDWIRVHARDRPVQLDEFRDSPAATPELKRLRGRLARLNSLLRSTEREFLALRQIARARGLL